MKNTLIIVEGFHDAEVIEKILKINSFAHIRNKDEVKSIWRQLIPSRFPVGNDLLERVNVPMFYDKDDSSIAIKICGSISKIVPIYNELRTTIYDGFKDIDNIFVIIDCDNNPEPVLRKKMITELSFPSIGKGVTLVDGKKYGLFIVPNNRDTGTIENMLIECGRIKYPDLMSRAISFVDGIDMNTLTDNDKEEILKPYGKNKAIIGVAANILKPGKSVTVSIHDNRWIESDIVATTSINSIAQYIMPNL
jgi:hypothetical protein